MGTSPNDDTISAAVLAFLQKDYELKVRFLVDHFGRMWTRFNFFMVATTALAIGLFQGLRDGKTLGDAIAFPIAGALLALCWYVFGAEDRYLVVAYRDEIARTARAIEKSLNLPRELARLEEKSESVYVAVGDVAQASVPPKYYQWRKDPISTTKLVAIFPLVVLFCWIALIALAALKPSHAPQRSASASVNAASSVAMIIESATPCRVG